jgi:hypothetical protein
MRLTEAGTADPAKRVRELLRGHGQTHVREAGFQPLVRRSLTRNPAAGKTTEES